MDGRGTVLQQYCLCCRQRYADNNLNSIDDTQSVTDRLSLTYNSPVFMELNVCMQNRREREGERKRGREREFFN